MLAKELEFNDLARINTAIECNNIGADLLSSRRLRQALQTLVRALKLIGLEYNGLPELITAISKDSGDYTTIEQQQDCPCSSSKPTRDQCARILYDARRKLEDLHSSPTVAIVENELCYDPLVLDFMEESTTISPEQTTLHNHAFRLQAAAIASNIGLVYQLFADFPSFKRSLCVYDFAFSLALSANLPSLFFTRLVCLCLCNSGVIYYTIGNSQMGQSCLQTLRVHMERLPEGPEKRSALERFQSILNSFSWSPPSRTA